MGAPRSVTPGRFRRAARTLWARRRARFGLVVVVAIIAVAVLARWVAPRDPLQQRLLQRLKPPGTTGHPLGTDNFGRDLFSRLVYGPRLSRPGGGASVG